MRRFTQLFRDLEECSKTSDQETALEDYFREAPRGDAAWALWLFWGNRLNLGISVHRLKSWAIELSDHPVWLFEACQERVGNLAETASLLLPRGHEAGTDLPLQRVIEEKLLPLKDWNEGFQLMMLREFWLSLDQDQRFILNKMLTGSIRIGSGRLLLLRGLSSGLGVKEEILAHRLSRSWQPSAEFLDSLADPKATPGAEEEAPQAEDLTLLLQDIADARRFEMGTEPRHRACLVMIHAHAGQGTPGRHADYALAARDGDRLVPVSRPPCSLPVEDIEQIEAWIQANTLNQRGPVRTVPAELVFEIGFEGLRPSKRHKSGLTLRYPRIIQWLKNKPVGEIDTLSRLRELLDG